MEILVAEDSRTQALRLSADPERRGFQILVERGQTGITSHGSRAARCPSTEQ